MKKYTIPGLKLGSTSFLLHADYVSAVRFTAERCEDVALLLLETGPADEWLISPREVDETARILDGEGASLHVHLPVDAHFETEKDTAAMLSKVRAAIERTAPLQPHSFVLHVSFPSLAGTGRLPSAGQFQRTARALRTLQNLPETPEQLAIENLEGYPVSFWDGWLEGSPLSRCLDAGHIWKDGRNPAPVLEDWFARIRLVHLHGLDVYPPLGKKPHDHRSLRAMPPEALDAVMHPLWNRNFAGVVNLEVFTPEDLAASHEALLGSWERLSGKPASGTRDTASPARPAPEGHEPAKEPGTDPNKP